MPSRAMRALTSQCRRPDLSSSFISRIAPFPLPAYRRAAHTFRYFQYLIDLIPHLLLPELASAVLRWQKHNQQFQIEE